MSDYTSKNTKIDSLMNEVLALNRKERTNFLQKLIVSMVKKDNSITIPMLRELGVTTEKLGKALEMHPDSISRDYPVKTLNK